MKPPPFDYVAPRSIDECTSLLGTSDREMKVIAGGQSLMPILNMRMASPEVLVDIARIRDFPALGVDADGALFIPADATQSCVAADPRVRGGWPLLAEAIGHIGHPQIRNRGTVCGSLAHADSAAELPAVTVLLGATMHLRSATSSRIVPAAGFFRGTFVTDLADDELLVGVRIPPLPAGTRWAFEEFTTRRGDFATVGAAVTLRRSGSTIEDPKVVLFGVGATPVRALQVEEAIAGLDPVDGLCRKAVVAGLRDLEPVGDVHASAEFRHELAVELATRMIHQAWESSDDH